MSHIDLHTHSTASDGSCTPAQIVELAAALPLQAVALTDHDTTAGLEEFLEAGKKYPELETIPGVELATRYGARELHIVGLFIDPGSAALQQFLEIQRDFRRKRNRDLQLKLHFLGYEITGEEPAFAEVGGISDNAGRPHFARAIMEKYNFPDLRTVFDKLLGNNRPAYVPRQLGSPAAAIAAIHAAGGVAVWAHPIYRDRNERAFLRRGARKLAERGIDALEGYYSLFGPAETELVTEIAGSLDLAVSGGSDFHGGNSPNIELGTGAGKLRVPAELLDKLHACRDRRLQELQSQTQGEK